MIITLVAVLLIILFFFTFYFVYLRKLKTKYKKLSKYADDISENLKSQGEDNAYNDLDDAELLSKYTELLNSFDCKKDLMAIAEIGCRTKFIEDILIRRGIEIPINR